MNKDDKELLIKEICSRLPYGVMCTDLRHGDSKITEVNTEDDLVYCYDFDEYIKVKDCRLYLRPLSSMTDEEKEEQKNLFDAEEITSDSICYLEGGTLEEYLSHISYSFCSEIIDWLNARHFDYRSLIERGLAIDCTDLNVY